MSAPASKFKVADLSLAAFGRKEIELAENEMPGLVETRKKVDISSLIGRVEGSRDVLGIPARLTAHQTVETCLPALKRHIS